MAIASTNDRAVVPATTAYARSADNLAESAFRISSGNRFRRIGDDASNVTTAINLETQTTKLRSALINGSRATSFLQVASGGIDKIRDVLDNLKSLTSTANGGGVTDRQFATLDAQFQSQLTRIDEIVASTTFGGNAVLDGSISGSAAPIIIVNDVESAAIALDIPDLRTSALFASTPNLANISNAAAATTPVADAGQVVDEAIATVEAYEKRLAFAESEASRRIYGIELAREDLIATDITEEQQRYDFIRLTQQQAATILAQTLGLSSSLLGLLDGGLAVGSAASSGKIPTAAAAKASTPAFTSGLAAN